MVFDQGGNDQGGRLPYGGDLRERTHEVPKCDGKGQVKKGRLSEVKG